MLVDASKWEKKRVDPNLVLLDPQNPRLRLTNRPEGHSQDAIRHHILSDSAFLGLCNSIVAFGGIYPFENIILLAENDEIIAIEGNRRVCACQLLLNPNKYLTDAALLAKIPRANDEILKNLSKIDAYIVRDRNIAAAIMARLHAIPQFSRHAWHTINRMAFVASRITEGQSYDAVAEDLSIDVSGVVELYKCHNILRYLQFGVDWDEISKTLLFPDSEDQDFDGFFQVVNSNSVQRHFGSPFFHDDGKVNDIGHPDLADKIKLIAKHTLLSDSSGSSVTFKKRDSVEKYLNTAFPRRAKSEGYTDDLFKKDISSRNSTNPEIDEADRETNGHPKLPQASRAQDISQSTEPKIGGLRTDDLFRNLKCSRDDPRLQELTRELRRLSSMQDCLSCFSIAYCLLMRALLEWSLIYHIQKVGGDVPKDRKGKYLGLSAIVKSCLDDDRCKFDRLAPTQKLLRIQSNWIDELHLVTHTEFANMSEARIKEITGDVRPLVNFILNQVDYN